MRFKISRSRSAGVHGGSGHHCKCCSPQGCCRPSASRARGCRRSSFAANDGNAAAVEAGGSSPGVGPVQRWGGTADCIGCGTSRRWRWWRWWRTGCSWKRWQGRPERWTGCFVLGLASAAPSWIEARHNAGRPGQFEPPNSSHRNFQPGPSTSIGFQVGGRGWGPTAWSCVSTDCRGTFGRPASGETRPPTQPPEHIFVLCKSGLWPLRSA